VGQFPSADPLLDIVNISAPASVSENSGGIRFDYNFSPKYRFYTRYFRDQGVSSQTQNSTLSLYNTTTVPQNAVASLSQLLSPTVLNETKTVDGVECRVVEERETKDGKLVEVSRNYFAIGKRTNSVYYFGEDVDIYKDDKVVSHEGAWLAGKNGARFGLMMPGLPLLSSARTTSLGTSLKHRSAATLTIPTFV
jgi:hypothetical protein